MNHPDLSQATFFDVRLSIPHKIVSMKEAIGLYKEGKSVGIIQEVGVNGAKVLLMGKQTTFTCNFDYLIGCTWVVISQ